ncbi:hypothetical protein [Streptomyces collinus]|uniref:hypothetical protein n=1 Tax=Streptomyces collinus TaxID=42684 RepID=UPI003631C38D
MPDFPCSSCPAGLELVAEGCGARCVRYNRVLLALLVLNLLATITFGVIGVVDDRGQSTKPDPKPSATATPSPRPSEPESSGGSTSTSLPTPSMPPDPTGGACNIFDPECDSGSTTGGATGG